MTTLVFIVAALMCSVAGIVGIILLFGIAADWWESNRGNKRLAVNNLEKQYSEMGIMITDLKNHLIMIDNKRSDQDDKIDALTERVDLVLSAMESYELYQG